MWEREMKRKTLGNRCEVEEFTAIFINHFLLIAIGLMRKYLYCFDNRNSILNTHQVID